MNEYLAFNFAEEELQEIEGLKIVLIPEIRCCACVKNAWDIIERCSNDQKTFVISANLNDLDKAYSKILVEEPESNMAMEDLYFLDIYPLLVCYDTDGNITTLTPLTPADDQTSKEKLTAKNI